jgi:SAM-dependent methyltransferase
MYTCRICGNENGNKEYILTEKMFGTGESFDYFKCGECGCLQIAELPDRLNEFYDSRYYSFKRPKSFFDNPVKSFFKRLRSGYYFSEKTLFSIIFLKVYPPPNYFVWLKEAGVNPDSRILDVGCGAGDLLVRMRKDSFIYLTGFDPYIKNNISMKMDFRSIGTTSRKAT